jgi:large subunit ribosomal protein L15
MAEQLSLSNLKPASPRKDRKRVGRGMGSGKGRYSGRGIKGQKSRSGSHKMRAGFEGGQMPIYMRLGKQRGRDLERFDAGAEITPQLLAESGLIRNAKLEVKILGHGDLSKKLTVTAHAFSASAKEKIEGAGGSTTALKEPKVKRRRKKSAKPAPAAPEAEASTDEPEEAPAEPEAAEPEAEAEAPADEES